MGNMPRQITQDICYCPTCKRWLTAGGWKAHRSSKAHQDAIRVLGHEDLTLGPGERVDCFGQRLYSAAWL
jgi:hypothetical protein